MEGILGLGTLLDLLILKVSKRCIWVLGIWVNGEGRGVEIYFHKSLKT